MSKSCSIKVLRLAVVAVAVWALGASAQTMCLYNGGGCWPEPGEAGKTCEWGWIFNGGTQGEDTYCEGGTYVGPGTNRKESDARPTPGQSAQGCCLWGGNADCNTVFTTQEVADCQTGTNTYWSGSACPSGGGCPTGTPTFDGGTKVVYGYCKWDNAEDNPNGYCYAVTDEKEVTDCSSGTNSYWASTNVPSGYTGNGPCPTTDATYDGGGGGGSGYNCLYSSGDCWPDDGGCLTAGWLFQGGKTGEGTLCSGGTWTGEGKGGEPPTTVGVSLGCCKWAENNPSGQCWDVTEATEVTDCSGGDNEFWSSPCPDKQGTCPGQGSIKLSNLQITKTAGLRATYARGVVEVNYTAKVPVVSGKIQLVSSKGRVVASAPITKNAGSAISAQLGFKKIPAGRYFVRINTKDTSGKKIVQQVPISIVK